MSSAAPRVAHRHKPKSRGREAGRLRARVIASLEDQGFALTKDGMIEPTLIEDKEVIRRLHAIARASAIDRASDGLRRHEDRLVESFADGKLIAPEKIRPRLVEIKPGSFEELLFRYARLHWSIPVSAGYGRRLRYAIFDDSNDKLMGVLGLGDPVFAIGPRDQWVGWDHVVRRDRLRHVMDAFLVGAVPPYSSLLVGKFVAMLLVSEEVREAFRRKYRGSDALISDRPFDGRLALVTTASALGRSSLYNRLRFEGRPLLNSVGYTAGSGEFHFANGLYHDLISYARANLEPTAKNDRWGNGWRSRREVVRQTLRHLGLHPDMLYHGVRRELFVAPLAANTREFLRGEHARLRPYRLTTEQLFESFRERWLLPRAERDERYREFNRDSLRLWEA